MSVHVYVQHLEARNKNMFSTSFPFQGFVMCTPSSCWQRDRADLKFRRLWGWQGLRRRWRRSRRRSRRRRWSRWRQRSRPAAMSANHSHMRLLRTKVLARVHSVHVLSSPQAYALVQAMGPELCWLHSSTASATNVEPLSLVTSSNKAGLSDTSDNLPDLESRYSQSLSHPIGPTASVLTRPVNLRKRLSSTLTQSRHL